MIQYCLLFIFTAAMVQTSWCIPAQTKRNPTQSETNKQVETKNMPNNKASIKISVSKNQDKKPVVEIILTNTDKENLWVNKRMMVNHPGSPKGFREVWFEIKNSKGNLLSFNCKVKAGFAKASDYIVLQPQSSISTIYNLSKCFKLDNSETYELKVYYQDGSEKPPQSSDNINHLSEKIESKIVKFENE